MTIPKNLAFRMQLVLGVNFIAGLFAGQSAFSYSFWTPLIAAAALTSWSFLNIKSLVNDYKQKTENITRLPAAHLSASLLVVAIVGVFVNLTIWDNSIKKELKLEQDAHVSQLQAELLTAKKAVDILELQIAEQASSNELLLRVMEDELDGEVRGISGSKKPGFGPAAKTLKNKIKLAAHDLEKKLLLAKRALSQTEEVMTLVEKERRSGVEALYRAASLEKRISLLVDVSGNVIFLLLVPALLFFVEYWFALSLIKSKKATVLNKEEG